MNLHKIPTPNPYADLFAFWATDYPDYSFEIRGDMVFERYNKAFMPTFDESDSVDGWRYEMNEVLGEREE